MGVPTCGIVANASDDSAGAKPRVDVDSDMVISGGDVGSGGEDGTGRELRMREEPKAASAKAGSCNQCISVRPYPIVVRNPLPPISLQPSTRR